MLFLIFGYFLPFYLLNSPKTHNLEKVKQHPGDVIILHKCTENYDQMMYGSWDMVHDGCNYWSFWAIFCPFIPLTARKIKIIKKTKKTPGDIIILDLCTKNYDQMMYSSWDMVCDKCNCYFSLWAIFRPITPLTAQKIKILKKRKKHLEISSFYISVPKIMNRWCTDPDISCTTDRQMDGRTDGWMEKVI